MYIKYCKISNQSHLLSNSIGYIGAIYWKIIAFIAHTYKENAILVTHLVYSGNIGSKMTVCNNTKFNSQYKNFGAIFYVNIENFVKI